MSLLTGWPHYSEATPLNPEAAISGFPLLISANRIPLLWEFVREDLGDIRATDSGNNRLPCHVIHYDYTGNQALIAVNVNKTTGNQPIRIWFGNSTGTTESISGEYGQWNTYHSGIKAFYPSGHGQDVTRYQNHITGTPSNPDENPILLTGGPMPGSYAAKYDFAAGDATGYRYHRSGYFAGGTGTLTTFTKPIQFGTHSSFFSESTLIALSNLGPDTPAGEELAYGLSHHSGTNQFWYNKGDGVRHVISAQEASSTGSWHHIGASFQIGETEVVFNDGSVTSTTDLSSQVNGVDSIHLGGISSSFMVESEQRYGAGSHRGAMSLTFIHDEFQPAEWSKYLYQAGDQDTFLPTWDTHISGLWGKSRTRTASYATAIKHRLFNTTSNTRTKLQPSFVSNSTGVEFPSNWNGYYELTPINPSGNLTGFTLVLDLTLLSGIKNRLKPDGSDIRVTDTGNNLIPSDLVFYKEGTGLLMMNPGVKHTGNQTFRFWYGNDIAERPHVNSLYGQWNTYSNIIRAYYPSGVGLDRTRNQRHLTQSGIVTGILGKFTSATGCFYGHDSYSSGLVDTATGLPLTLLTWVKNPFHNAGGSYMSLVPPVFASKHYYLREGANNRFNMGAAGQNSFDSAGGAASGLWMYVGGVVSGSATGVAYINTILSGVTGQQRFNGLGFSVLATGLRYIAINSEPIMTIGSETSKAYYLSQYQSGTRPNEWLYYDYLMGDNQSGFWGGVSAGSVVVEGGSATVTDIYGSNTVDRGIAGNSNTSTSLTNHLNMAYGLGTTSNTRTTCIGTVTLDELVSLSLEGNIDVRTSSSLTINLAIRFNVVSPNRTQDIGSLSLLKQLQSHIGSITHDMGSVDVTYHVSILGQDDTRTSTTCSLDIESNSITSIVNILTRLTGSLSLASESNGEIVEFPVYITLNSEGNYIITRNHSTIQTIIGED